MVVGSRGNVDQRVVLVEEVEALEGEDDGGDVPLSMLCSLVFNRFYILSRNRRANVYFAADVVTSKIVVLRMVGPEDKVALGKELRVYKQLWNKDRNWKHLKNKIGISVPQFIMTGKDCVQNSAVYFAISYAGESLEQLYDRKAKKDSLIPTKLLCQIARKGIELLRILHEEGYVHRDIHPGNFLISKDKNVLSLIDYQTAKKHQSEDFQHENVGQGRQGSLRSYCTADIEERSYCRVDDMEALALMLINLKRDQLPWKTNEYLKNANTPEQQRRYMANNVHTAPEICKGLPKVFSDFLEKFKDHQSGCEPDYEEWIYQFRQTETFHLTRTETYKIPV